MVAAVAVAVMGVEEDHPDTTHTEVRLAEARPRPSIPEINVTNVEKRDTMLMTAEMVVVVADQDQGWCSLQY